MRPTSLIAMWIVLTSAAPTLASGFDGGMFAGPARVLGSADPEIHKARQRARKAVAGFIARLEKRSAADLEFAIQVEITEGVDAEQLWLADVRFDGGAFVGYVDSRPLRIESVEQGERLRIPAAEITDLVDRRTHPSWRASRRRLHPRGSRVPGAPGRHPGARGIQSSHHVVSDFVGWAELITAASMNGYFKSSPWRNLRRAAMRSVIRLSW